MSCEESPSSPAAGDAAGGAGVERERSGAGVDMRMRQWSGGLAVSEVRFRYRYYHHGTLLTITIVTHPDTGTKVDKGLERSRKQRIDAITWEHEGKIYNPESIIDRDNFGWFSKHVMNLLPAAPTSKRPDRERVAARGE